MNEKHYEDYLKYINNYWKKIIFEQKKDKKTVIGLPNKFISPTRRKKRFKGYQFYWDSYFIILGLVKVNKIKLAKGMVNNFAYLQKRFGIIPLRNSFYNLGISQIPFLTSMIKEVYKHKKNKRWLKKMTKVAVNELNSYWLDEHHLVYKGLSRYCDHYITHLTAEHESGWDMTSRFNNRCLNKIPIDLNCCLYVYEKDIAEFYEILGKKSLMKKYSQRAAIRKKRINQLMWDKNKEFFFDYNYKYEKIEEFYSLAGFFPLWANIATKEQAKKMVKKLKRFEYKGGLACTQKNKLKKDEIKQWDYPNGWANLHWIVIKGLQNYGFKKDAKRIAKKWLDLNVDVFLKTGKFWEKYDVVNCDIGKYERYPTESGFAWTNAIFLKIIKDLKELN